jgi:hypothetical protein
MDTRVRWAVIIGALLLAAAVGYTAYNAGIERGIEQSGRLVAAPPGAVPYYYWHGPHFGGWIFIPFLFAFWIVAFRAFRGHHRHYRCRYEEDRPRD